MLIGWNSYELFICDAGSEYNEMTQISSYDKVFFLVLFGVTMHFLNLYFNINNYLFNDEKRAKYCNLADTERNRKKKEKSESIMKTILRFLNSKQYIPLFSFATNIILTSYHQNRYE